MPRLLIVADGSTPAPNWDAALRDRGFAAETAAGPDDALRRLRGGDFDIVLGDLDLCRRVHAEPDLGRLPVVVARLADPAHRERLLDILLSASEDAAHFDARHRREIEHRRSAEQALRASTQRHRSLVVATSQIIWTTDPEGMVVDDMPSWRAFTGRSRDEIAGCGWLQDVHPDDRERTAEAWSRAVATRTRYETEYRLRRADGVYRHVAVRGVPLSDECDWTHHYWEDPVLSAPGAVLVPADAPLREWVGVCTDITDRKTAEAELTASATCCTP